jgi:hypothetical protein
MWACQTRLSLVINTCPRIRVQIPLVENVRQKLARQGLLSFDQKGVEESILHVPRI